jgi:hypothetical protein
MAWILNWQRQDTQRQRERAQILGFRYEECPSEESAETLRGDSQSSREDLQCSRNDGQEVREGMAFKEASDDDYIGYHFERLGRPDLLSCKGRCHPNG